MGFAYSLRYFDAKLMCPLKIAGRASLHHGDDTVTLLQHMWDPPVEGGCMVYTSSHCEFCSLNGM